MAGARRWCPSTNQVSIAVGTATHGFGLFVGNGKVWYSQRFCAPAGEHGGKADGVNDEVSELAQEIHGRAFVFDAHADTAGLQASRENRIDLSGELPGYHVDLPKLRAGGVNAQVFACAVGAADTVTALRTIGLLLDDIRRHDDDLLVVRESGDFSRAEEAGKIACVIALEGSVPLHGEPGVFFGLCEAGVRLVTLAHWEQPTPWSAQADASYFGLCDAAFRQAERTERRGLTAWGKELVGLMNDAGVVIDVAHCNDATFYQVLELSAQPVVFSHGCVFARHPHSRNLTDDQLVALAETGGVMGMAFYDKFVAENQGDLEGLLDHFEHAVEVAGPDAVGLGSDFDGLPAGTVPLVPDAARLPLLTEGFVRRGFDEETIRKILGGNFRRVFEQVLGSRSRSHG